MTVSLSYQQPDSKTTLWWVVFADEVILEGANPAPWPIRWLTSVGFRHVFAFTAGEQGTQIIDPMWSGLDVRWSPFTPDQCAQACLDTHHRVLKLAKFENRSYPLRGVITCVSVVKAVVGLRAWMAITPRQLYRELIKQGALEL
jgi:hypothetical protein